MSQVPIASQDEDKCCVCQYPLENQVHRFRCGHRVHAQCARDFYVHTHRQHIVVQYEVPGIHEPVEVAERCRVQCPICRRRINVQDVPLDLERMRAEQEARRLELQADVDRRSNEITQRITSQRSSSDQPAYAAMPASDRPMRLARCRVVLDERPVRANYLIACERRDLLRSQVENAPAAEEVRPLVGRYYDSPSSSSSYAPSQGTTSSESTQIGSDSSRNSKLQKSPSNSKGSRKSVSPRSAAGPSVVANSPRPRVGLQTGTASQPIEITSSQSTGSSSHSQPANVRITSQSSASTPRLVIASQSTASSASPRLSQNSPDIRDALREANLQVAVHEEMLRQLEQARERPLIRVADENELPSVGPIVEVIDSPERITSTPVRITRTFGWARATEYCLLWTDGLESVHSRQEIESYAPNMLNEYRARRNRERVALTRMRQAQGLVARLPGSGRGRRRADGSGKS